MTDYFALAEHWLEQSFDRESPEAGRECLMTAQVYAALAVAHVIAAGLEAHAMDLARAINQP